MPVESIRIPDIGDASDVEVVEILVSEGQKVDKDESLLVLESDKAAMEIPAPHAGVVKKILLKVGDSVSEGKEMLTLEIEGEAVADEAPAAQASEPAAAEAPETVDEPATEAAAGGESRAELVNVPDIGDDGEVEVIEVHVAVGDIISAEDPLITLESDKAAMDIPSPFAGEVTALKIKVGDKVAKGAPILELQVSSGGAASAAEKAPQAASAQSEAASESKTGSGKTSMEGAPQNLEEESLQQKQQAFVEQVVAQPAARVHAGPAVRKLARELGVNLGQVKGTGAKGRIQKEDVQNFVKSHLQGAGAAATPVSGGAGIPAIPDIDFSQFGEVEEVAMSKLHRITAENMHRNWLNVPAVAQFNEADVTNLEDFRAAQKKTAEKKGVRLTPLPFLIKACAKALQEYPQFNVSLHSSGERLIQKKYVHIGVAVATEAGLMVPVVRDADRKSIWEIAADIAELGEKARNRRLSKDDMQGACFTISSLGALGGTGFTPIVNAPEVGILGVSKTQIKPVWQNGEFVPRQMLPFTLCYDHRAVNGMDAGMFATYLADVLSDIRLLMM